MRARALRDMISIEGVSIHKDYEYELCINILYDDSVKVCVNNDGSICTFFYNTRTDMYRYWKFARTSMRRMSVAELFKRNSGK